jgi:hypothetical protein
MVRTLEGVRWLDGALLIDLWDELDLPAPIRSAWKPAVKWATAGPSVEIFWDAFVNGGNPSRTATTYIGDRDEPLPPPAPPPRRRVDPVNDHPWGRCADRVERMIARPFGVRY